ncbi:FAD-linked oxidoreductase [Aspergillus steynii IBT 23096]|uniref:Proline dehydrogenase n=1 Tax=Aspergillus steynii IBT 23096 TaxID=1392250 RepID=A0A2I2GCL6_9EURO|nr:FAD-linked oxidoreductase [Aspergillus steynii IBT 23096]PLB50610.1 FAD-linked oxidoreductase [Aspergillus steynii IBT 23096]
MTRILAKATPRPGLVGLARTSSPALRRWQHVRVDSTLEVGSTHTNSAVSSSSSSSSTPPLAALPNGVLLRSLLIAAISSKPYLLGPSLRILSKLTQPGHGLLLDVDRNVLLHRLLKLTFYKQFCAGETGSETQQTLRHMKDLGFRGTILTYAKETVFDHKTNKSHGLGITTDLAQEKTQHCPTIEAWRKGTLETIDLLGDGDYLAVKLSGAGPAVNDAFAAGELPPAQMLAALEEIGSKCRDRRVRILVDGESQHFQQGILRVTMDLMRRYNREGSALVYNTYQAYLKSTPATLARHLEAAQREGFTLGLKLVRGAYIASDQRSLIHDTKADTDAAFDAIAQGALRQEIGAFGASSPAGKPFPSVNLFLASHNQASVVAAHQLHRQRVQDGLPTVPVGFAQLHGMSDAVSFGLLKLKGSDGTPEVYKCSTWGKMGECLAYLLRRAIENRDAVGRTGEEFLALKKEAWRRLGWRN